jgi:hypothetical protein
LSHENAGGMADTVSWHTLLGASPIYAIGSNEDEIKSVETDPSLDGNNSSVNLCSALEIVAESVDLSKSNDPSQDNISHDGVPIQKSDPVVKLSVLDDRKPCNQDNHDDANESERADTSNDALPLLDFRKPRKKRALAANWEGPYQFIGHVDGKGNFDFEEGRDVHRPGC